MSELKINNVSVLTESGGEVTGTLKTLKMGATTVFTESGGTVTAQNMGFSANDAGIKAALNASGTAPIYACRAWVNFNGKDAFSPNPGTSAIRDAGNVSSITQHTSGQFTINFDVNMPNANYSVCVTSSGDINNYNGTTSIYYTGNTDNYVDSGSVRIRTTGNGGLTTLVNPDTVCVAVFY